MNTLPSNLKFRYVVKFVTGLLCFSSQPPDGGKYAFFGGWGVQKDLPLYSGVHCIVAFKVRVVICIDSWKVPFHIFLRVKCHAIYHIVFIVIFVFLV